MPLFDLRALVEAGQILAYVVVTIIIFAECGLLIGFFLPGDSLLFTAGFLASQKIPNTKREISHGGAATGSGAAG